MEPNMCSCSNCACQTCTVDTCPCVHKCECYEFNKITQASTNMQDSFSIQPTNISKENTNLLT